MRQCGNCSAQMKEEVLDRYEDDLLGIPVVLTNSVIRRGCDQCGEETITIPDQDGLVAVVAMTRALVPLKLTGNEIRFFRKALNMTGREFAAELEVSPETVSRWENDGQTVGGYSEKMIRHTVCALLHEKAPAVFFDPSDIARMKTRVLREDMEMPLLEFERVKVVDTERRTKTRGWDTVDREAA